MASLTELANPARFMRLSSVLLPWLAGAAALLLAIGFYLVWFVAPSDYQQGETIKIMYIHVPAAWLSMFVYVCLAVASFLALVFRHALADAAAQAAAPLGAAFTCLALVTGALWGRPMWGAWWVWDARLTSELILLFLYVGFIALQSAIDDPRRADKAGAILALVGVVNVPIIYFSVKWWNTLHQGSSVNLTKSSMATTMLWGMLLCALACWMYAIAVALMRVRRIILERERETAWVRETLARQTS